MENKNSDKLKKLSDFLKQNPSTFSIFENSIDIDIQEEFYDLLETLNNKSATNEIDPLKQIDKLYKNEYSHKRKKEILSLLSNINKVEAYRAIELFIKNGDEKLRKWATIALQQSRIMLESSFLNEKSLYISTGLGGKGDKLRYFCVFFTYNQQELQNHQQNIVRKEIEFAFHQANVELESIEFTKGVIIFTSLIPLDSDIKELFDNIIAETNNYGNILKTNLIITNVKSFNIKEINKLLNKKSEE